MQHGDKDRRAPDGLLLLVSSDGIPLLVRAYGEVRTPPSAAVGVASALFHAAKRDKTAEAAELQLQALETTHRTVVYELTALGFLLGFVSDKPRTGSSACVSVRRMLRVVSAALVMLVGERSLQSSDGSKLRAAIAQQMEVVDRIVTTFRSDVRLLLGRPVRPVIGFRKLDTREIGDDTLLWHGLWLEKGVLVGEYVQPDATARLDASELLILIIMAECVARRECDYTHHVARVSVPTLESAMKVVICNSSKAPLVTFIGIFDEDMHDNKSLLESAGKLMVCCPTKGPQSSPVNADSGDNDQLGGLPDALMWYAGTYTPNCRRPASCRALNARSDDAVATRRG